MRQEIARWRFRRLVQSLLLSTTDRSPLRRAYHVIRRAPGVGHLWRSLGGGDAWRDVAAYARRSGVFLGAQQGLAKVPSFSDPAYFEALVSAASLALRPTHSPECEVVLVNNGLSAGGAERQIVRTLEGLSARGVRAAFVGELLGRAPGLDFYEGAAAASGAAVIALPRRRGPGKTLYDAVSRPVAELLARAPDEWMLEILDMSDVLRRLSPKVAHLWQDQTSAKHAFSALIAGVPRIVLSGRNLNPTHFIFHEPHMRDAYRALLASGRVALTNNTQAGARSYADWLGVDPSSVAVIRNAFEPPQREVGDDRPTVRKRLGVADDQCLVLGVFRLSSEKRPLLWIDAAVEAHRQNSSLVFAIAGDGPMADVVRTRIKALNMSGQFRLLGVVNPIDSYYRAADLFMLASSEEGAPNVLIEAQHFGLASVVTDAGGVAETICDDETARLVRHDDPVHVGSILASTARDREFLARARVEGPRRVQTIFGLRQMVDDTIRLYGL